LTGQNMSVFDPISSRGVRDLLGTVSLSAAQLLASPQSLEALSSPPAQDRTAIRIATDQGDAKGVLADHDPEGAIKLETAQFRLGLEVAYSTLASDAASPAMKALALSQLTGREVRVFGIEGLEDDAALRPTHLAVQLPNNPGLDDPGVVDTNLQWRFFPLDPNESAEIFSSLAPSGVEGSRIAAAADLIAFLDNSDLTLSGLPVNEGLGQRAIVQTPADGPRWVRELRESGVAPSSGRAGEIDRLVNSLRLVDGGFAGLSNVVVEDTDKASVISFELGSDIDRFYPFWSIVIPKEEREQGMQALIMKSTSEGVNGPREMIKLNEADYLRLQLRISALASQTKRGVDLDAGGDTLSGGAELMDLQLALNFGARREGIPPE